LILVPAGVALFVVPTARAKLLLIQGNYLKAALIYETILIKKPEKVKLYPLLANIYLMLNRNDDTARKVYDIALRMDISPQLRQRLDELTVKKIINNNESSDIEKLEEQLKRELLTLKNS
jgi:tetratricopeptide (TPR) repeat protein